MAWALSIASGDYLLTGNVAMHTRSGSADWAYVIDAEIPDGNIRLVGNANFGSYLNISSGNITFRYGASSGTSVSISISHTFNNSRVELAIYRSGNDHIVTVDGVQVGSTSSTNSGSGNSVSYINRINTVTPVDWKLFSFKFKDGISGSLIYDWNAETSDHSNTGFQPILTENVSGQDASGVGFPTDGSAWVDLGGGSISVTEQIVNTSYTSNDPAITLTGTVSITENVVNTNYSAIDPTVTLTAPGVVSVTEQLVNVNYTSLNPVVTLTGVISITENLVNTNYTALNPVIDLTGLIDITESTTNTNYEVNNPTITLTSGAIEIIEQAANTQYQSKNPSVLLTPEPLGIVSTVCFNGCLIELGYNGTSKSVVFNGEFKELSFNGTIQTTCNTGSIKTNC